MPVHIDRLDLKMLKVLMALERTRNTYRAAEQLHLSQSAVSRALARLREALDDPVFVREPGGLKPTPLAQRLVARLPGVLDMLSDAVEEGAGFDPENWPGEVSIALSSHVMHCWGLKIHSALSTGAPLAKWNFHAWHTGSVKHILDGQLDLGIHLQNDSWEQSLYQQKVGLDPFCLLVRRGHPAAGATVEHSMFDRFGLVSLLLPDWNEHGNRLESTLHSHGIPTRVSVRCESLTMALNCLKSSDCMMAGTRELADATEELETLELPDDLNITNLPIVICYPRRMQNSTSLGWLTSTIEAAIKGLHTRSQ